MIPAGLSPIPSLSGAYISETGDLWIAPWRGSDGRRLPGGWKKPYVRKDGYNIVMVFGKPHLLHRLIALAYLPNPEGYPVVRHRDDNPSHNEVGNLVWGTHSDNTQDMIARGRARFQRLTHCVNGHDIKDRDTILKIGTRVAIAGSALKIVENWGLRMTTLGTGPQTASTITGADVRIAPRRRVPEGRKSTGDWVKRDDPHNRD